MSKLTAKQAMFCKEYLIDLNATQAAIRAGYSEKTAAVTGCENLIKPNVASEIQALMAKREKKVTAEVKTPKKVKSKKSVTKKTESKSKKATPKKKK